MKLVYENDFECNFVMTRKFSPISTCEELPLAIRTNRRSILISNHDVKLVYGQYRYSYSGKPQSANFLVPSECFPPVECLCSEIQSDMWGYKVCVHGPAVLIWQSGFKQQSIRASNSQPVSTGFRIDRRMFVKIITDLIYDTSRRLNAALFTLR